MHGFFMDKYEKTRTDYERVMGSNPSTAKGCEECPVDNMRWDEAREFSRKSSKRFPTETEWEYADRAVTTTQFSFENTLPSDPANFNSYNNYRRANDHPIKSLDPHTAGHFKLFDDPHWCTCASGIVAVIVAVLFSIFAPMPDRKAENVDYLLFYEPVARMLLNKSFFNPTMAQERQTFRYPPGLSFMLAGVFAAAGSAHVPEGLAYRLFAILCAAISAMLAFKIGCWFWSTRGALCVALAWSSYPLWLWSLAQPVSETPFVPVLMMSILLLLDIFHGCKSPIVKSALLGFAYGVAMLIRPIALLLPLLGACVIIGSMAYRRMRTRFALTVVMIATACAVIAPWELWMHAKTGAILPLSQNGPVSMYDGLTFTINGTDFRQPLAMPADVEALMRRINVAYAESQTFRHIASTLAHEAVVAPGAVLKLALIKAGRSWFGTNSHRRESGVLAAQLVYLVFGLTGMALYFKRRRGARAVVLVMVLHLAYFWLMTMAFLSLVRYMMPVMALLFVFLPANLLALKKKKIVESAGSVSAAALQ
jgi:Sulfatase-modifying factor enzyme 1/Dolichyl-phosphate-mannose-protein mannosyltransferase